MSRTFIENVLFGLYIKTFCKPEGAHYREAYNDIAWYVETERACSEWVKALGKANPDKLLRRVGEDAHSTDEVISITTSYLRRYCGLTD